MDENNVSQAHLARTDIWLIFIGWFCLEKEIRRMGKTSGDWNRAILCFSCRQKYSVHIYEVWSRVTLRHKKIIYEWVSWNVFREIIYKDKGISASLCIFSVFNSSGFGYPFREDDLVVKKQQQPPLDFYFFPQVLINRDGYREHLTRCTLLMSNKIKQIHRSNTGRVLDLARGTSFAKFFQFLFPHLCFILIRFFFGCSRRRKRTR